MVRHSSLTPARILTRNGDASLSRHVAPEVAAVAFLTSDEAGTLHGARMPVFGSV